MKLFLATVLLATSFSVTAAPVFLYPNCNVYSGECTLHNTSGKDVNCNIQIRGMTKSGRPVTAFEYRMLYNGMFAWIRVNSFDFNDPITSLNGNAFCDSIN